MTRFDYYEDLSICDHFHVPGLRAVGWLDPYHDFDKGEVPEGVRLKLAELLQQGTWHPFPCMGGLVCGLCEGVHGQQNLFIPWDSVIFVAPDLIGHSIAEHDYRPPAVFQEAVLACPPMLSEEYLSQVRSLGITDQVLERVWRY